MDDEFTVAAKYSAGPRHGGVNPMTESASERHERQPAKRIVIAVYRRSIPRAEYQVVDGAKVPRKQVLRRVWPHRLQVVRFLRHNENQLPPRRQQIAHTAQRCQRVLEVFKHVTAQHYVPAGTRYRIPVIVDVEFTSAADFKRGGADVPARRIWQSRKVLAYSASVLKNTERSFGRGEVEVCRKLTAGHVVVFDVDHGAVRLAVIIGVVMPIPLREVALTRGDAHLVGGWYV